LSGTGRPRPLGHANQSAALQFLKRALGIESAEASDPPSPPGDYNLAACLHSLQILAEAIV
jgi:hypothetical protein